MIADMVTQRAKRVPFGYIYFCGCHHLGSSYADSLYLTLSLAGEGADMGSSFYKHSKSTHYHRRTFDRACSCSSASSCAPQCRDVFYMVLQG